MVALIVGALIDVASCKEAKTTEEYRKIKGVSADKIRLGARIAFPVGFLVFNVAYWATFQTK